MQAVESYQIINYDENVSSLFSCLGTSTCTEKSQNEENDSCSNDDISLHAQKVNANCYKHIHSKSHVREKNVTTTKKCKTQNFHKRGCSVVGVVR